MKKYGFWVLGILVVLLGILLGVAGRTLLGIDTAAGWTEVVLARGDDEGVMNVDGAAALQPVYLGESAGAQIFASTCVGCHGTAGEGSAIAPSLRTADIRERELDDLIATITNGVPETAMISWGHSLPAEDITAVAEFLRDWEAPDGELIADAIPEFNFEDPALQNLSGEALYNATCATCHGVEGEGGLGPALNSQQVLSNHDAANMMLAVEFGTLRPGSIMPAFGDYLTTVQIESLVTYVRAWEPTAEWVADPRGTMQVGGGGPMNGGQMGNGHGGGADAGGMAAAAQTAAEMRGTVTAVTRNSLLIQTENGESINANLGPVWYWTAQSVTFNAGDAVTFSGFAGGADHLELNWITNHSSGATLRLRENGRPIWNGARP